VENLTPSLVTEIITATHTSRRQTCTRNRDDRCSRFLLQETGIQHTSVADAAEISFTGNWYSAYQYRGIM
jgi:hypothetical protein